MQRHSLKAVEMSRGVRISILRAGRSGLGCSPDWDVLGMAEGTQLLQLESATCERSCNAVVRIGISPCGGETESGGCVWWGEP